VYREPEHVLLTDGDGHVRAFPVESIESVNGRTRLRCSRHPGFDYDAATKVLTERSFPFRAVDGPAQVRSPSRAWIQTGAKRPTARRVRTSSRLSVDGTNVEPTDEWVSASR
ncbi:MAG: hypothetical protein QGI83_13415, partial [Candidatus Latescibacteria bacterium]|jgi:hypothetical protein|nr:hypothetical protein [Candidatus Latescibacterota bacterium]